MHWLQFGQERKKFTRFLLASRDWKVLYIYKWNRASALRAQRAFVISRSYLLDTSPRSGCFLSVQLAELTQRSHQRTTLQSKTRNAHIRCPLTVSFLNIWKQFEYTCAFQQSTRATCTYILRLLHLKSEVLNPCEPEMTTDTTANISGMLFLKT